MDPRSIVNQIELLSKQKIEPGRTLLFFDEVQQCPNALKSLRYFKEEMPELHVIAAGSLLEFSLNDSNFSFPVGRVQFAHLYPLSFEEYLEARNDSALRQALYSYDCSNPPPKAVHETLLNRLSEYFFIGGMPASILSYLKTDSFLEVTHVQKALMDSFEADFGKYARQSQHRHLRRIFQEAPRLIGTHVKYSRIDPEIPNPTREMKQALLLLQQAGLIRPIFATSDGALPLVSGIKESIFKLLFLDIGLVEQSLQMEFVHLGVMTGALAEQFVGQEICAVSDPLLEPNLFFWSREQGSAEVDYLIAHQGKIYPIEVKAGATGKLKSLHLFVREKKAPFGIKISSDTLNWNGEILSIPLYLTSHVNRLIESLIAVI
jgi:uncharacterized protein